MTDEIQYHSFRLSVLKKYLVTCKLGASELSRKASREKAASFVLYFCDSHLPFFHGSC